MFQYSTMSDSGKMWNCETWPEILFQTEYESTSALMVKLMVKLHHMKLFVNCILTEYETECETVYEIVCETAYETAYETVCKTTYET